MIYVLDYVPIFGLNVKFIESYVHSSVVIENVTWNTSNPVVYTNMFTICCIMCTKQHYFVLGNS